MTRTYHLYIKKDLYFAPKIKSSNIFLGDPVTGTFKKLSYERKLGLYFSLLTSLALKILSDQSFKESKLKKSFKRCFFSKEIWTTSDLSACQMFAKCVDDPQVLELLQKCFVRIKTAKN